MASLRADAVVMVPGLPSRSLEAETGVWRSSEAFCLSALRSRPEGWPADEVNHGQRSVNVSPMAFGSTGIWGVHSGGGGEA